MKLSEEIRLLSPEEGEMLSQDKLPRSKYNPQGLYLVCNGANNFTAYDYYDRQNWIETFGLDEGTSKGWSENFRSPLRAIDWLHEVK